MNKIPIVVSIAGSDSSGGAGVQADIKTISALRGYAATVITALTAQNTRTVSHVEAVSADMLHAQWKAIESDLSVDAIKIGMLFNSVLIGVVSRMLPSNIPIVLDPVMVSQQGAQLLQETAVNALTQQLFSRATLITPNIPESELLLGMKIKNQSDMSQAASSLGETYQTSVLVKGGHLPALMGMDVLYYFPDQQCHWFSSPRIHTRHTHGTGCTLSSAIATYLAYGSTVLEAVEQGKAFLTEALCFADQLSVGLGDGPVHHFYRWS